MSLSITGLIRLMISPMRLRSTSPRIRGAGRDILVELFIARLVTPFSMAFRG